MKMKILITGAHFTPAQAVIEELKKNPMIEMVYIGRKYTREGDQSLSTESQVLPKLNIRFIPIVTGRLQRSFTRYTIPSLLKIPLGFIQAFYFLLKTKPDVVLSFGGYVSVPVVISSWFLSIPVIIHQQTLIAGLSDMISSWFAEKIAVSFPDETLHESKIILTGNPIRKELINVDEKQIGVDLKKIISDAKREGLPLILITGGNQGSHVINEAVEKIIKDLTEIAFVVHQTGDSKFQDFERLKDLEKELKKPERYMVRKWINGVEVGWLFKNSTLIVCRAGINTLLECCYFARPLLIIPIPVKEQIVNAEYFQKLGNAKVLWQKNLDGPNLLKFIKEGLENLEELEEKAKNTKEIVIADAAKRLALETILLGKGHVS